MQAQPEPLIEERRYFAKHQSDWEKAHAGKFVLVKGKQLVGTFNRAEDAVAESARRFGTEPFLVRSVEQTEQEIYIPALALGILNARSNTQFKAQALTLKGNRSRFRLFALG